MSGINLGGWEDVSVFDGDVPSDRLVLFVCGAEAEVRVGQVDGEILVPIADETENTFLNRRVYRLEPTGTAPWQREWRWFARFQNQRHKSEYRVAKITLEFGGERAVTWMPKDEEADWSVDIEIEGVSISGPFVDSFGSFSDHDLLPYLSQRLRGVP